MAATLREYWDELEGDWSIHHHRDLVADVFGPNQIGLRKLKVYIEALPPESATMTARKANWTEGDEQGASQIQLLWRIAQHTYDAVQFQYPKGKTYKPAEPPSWPRPWTSIEPEKPQAPPLSRAAMRAALLGS